MYAALMSTNRNVANLSIIVVKTLVKMAGFGGSSQCRVGSEAAGLE